MPPTRRNHHSRHHKKTEKPLTNNSPNTNIGSPRKSHNMDNK